MTRAKKILSASLVALLVLLLAALFIANWLLDSYSRQAMAGISQRAKRHGVVISDPWFTRARVAGVRTVRWSGLSARLQFPGSDAFDAEESFDVQVEQADLWLLGGGQAILEARNIAIDSVNEASDERAGPAGATQGEEVRVERFRCQFPLELFHPAPSVEKALPELVKLLQAGATPLPIEADGTLEFTFKGSPVRARMRVDRVGSGQALLLEPEDLRPVSERFDDPLTEAELMLIASNPLRVARLLRIKDDAETTSSRAKGEDASVPEDAYRHVLWSYLLTRQYGAKFAQTVTDAHEQGDTGNTPAEREMDYHNNAIGRRWAEAKVRRSEILSRVIVDPEVIREPQ